MSTESVTYSIGLRDLFSSGLAKMSSGVDSFEDKLSAIGKKTEKVGGLFSGLGGTISGALAGIGIAAFGADVFTTGRQLEGMRNSLTFTAGSAQEGAAAMDFLGSTASRLGTDLQSSLTGFTSLSAATKGTALDMQATKNIFEGVSVAASAMNLSGEASEGIFLALGQMVSKGKVSAEELTGQLGERLPGALGIAARAMGTTTAGLSDMMQKGQLISADFLPKFANELKNTFGGALAESTQSTTANTNRMANEWLLFKDDIFTSVRPAINSIISGLGSTIGLLRSGITFVKEHSTTFKLLGGVVATLGAAWAGYNIVTGIATLGTSIFTAGQWLLNAALTANPIGLVVAGLGALAAGFLYAYKNSQTFRAVLGGLFEVVKTLGSGFVGLGKMIAGVLIFDKGLIERGANQFAQAGASLGGAFKKGFDGVLASEKKELVTATQTKKSTFSELGSTGMRAATAKPPKTRGLGSAVGAVSGTKSTNITIQINKLVENLNINTTNLKESAGKIREEVAKVLLTAMNDANNFASSGG